MPWRASAWCNGWRPSRAVSAQGRRLPGQASAVLRWFDLSGVRAQSVLGIFCRLWYSGRQPAYLNPTCRARFELCAPTLCAATASPRAWHFSSSAVLAQLSRSQRAGRARHVKARMLGGGEAKRIAPDHNSTQKPLVRVAAGRSLPGTARHWRGGIAEVVTTLVAGAQVRATWPTVAIWCVDYLQDEGPRLRWKPAAYLQGRAVLGPGRSWS